MSYQRTPEHRALRAALIQQWKPWQNATGPQTATGKQTSARNAWKHGMRSRAIQDELRTLRALVRSCAGRLA
ncbi:hypothetical protein [Silvimonas soli]|uniref:hypothetical protein n=1 Tax=Silvimonas soli TaxID=2980100 RepID=UPI0024B33040|nr:hypothetical protein [Silvimonas soli]